MNDIISVAKEYLDPFLVDSAMSLAPYLGELNQNIKINRTIKRLKEHSEQLSYINELFHSELVSKEYIQNTVAPIVLTNLIEEHEDSKITYLLNGFQNVFLEEKADESIVIHYFDTLRQLRYADLRILHYIAGLDSPYPSGVYYEGSEYDALFKSICIKLSNMFLIDIRGRYGAILGKVEPSRDDVKLNLDFGKHFLVFVAKDKEVKELLYSM